MFSQILKQWFWDSYDHLGRLLVGNLVLFFILFPVVLYLFSGLSSLSEGLSPAQTVMSLSILLILVAPILLTLWLASLSHFAGLASSEKDPPLRAFLGGLRHQGFRCWKYFQVQCLILGILFMNIWFYTGSGTMAGTMETVGYGLAGICFWVSVVLILMMLPGVPFLVRQERSVLSAMKISLVILLRFPMLIIGFGLFLLSLWVIGAALRFAGILIFGFAGTAMLMNSLYDVLIDMEERQEKAAKRSGDGRPRTWKELRALEEEDEEERMRKVRYERTLRDLLKPWED